MNTAWKLGIKRSHRILRPNIQVVVETPVILSHPSRRVEETLDQEEEHFPRSHNQSQGLERLKDTISHVWGVLEDVWKDEIEQMNQVSLTLKAQETQGQIPQAAARYLLVNLILAQ